MDLNQLKELVKLMVDNDLSEVEVRSDEQTTLYLRRGPEKGALAAPAPMMYAPQAAASAQAPAPSAAAPAPAHAPGLIAIESPMVGTFYSAPNPDTPPFAKPGSQVTPDSVVCLIEAMKVFNEIKSEVSGTIERVLVKSGDAVEFGQKLFLVRP